MSGHSHTEYLGDSSFESYFAALDEQKRQQLTGFYDEYCTPPNASLYSDHDHIRRLPMVTYGRTPHNLFIAVRSAIAAHTNPDDYAIVACSEHDDDMRTEAYEIQEIRHAKKFNAMNLDRIIYAKGETRSDVVAIELGSSAIWIERAAIKTNQREMEIEMPFPVQPFFIPR